MIALGGGSVLSERVRDALEGHTTVLLDVDADDALGARAGATPGGRARPLARDRDAFAALHAERRELYEALADAIVAGLPERRRRRARCGALSALAAAPAGTRLLWAAPASGEYPVLVGARAARAGRSGLAERAVAARPRAARARSASATRPSPRCYGARLGRAAPRRSRSRRARAPRRSRAPSACGRSSCDGGMTRADHVVALGGGVVGDLAGFCAATYQRGVPVVQVPTTLVAQVDSAYGGKTGVDLPQAKNYVGAYHQPAGVIVDPDVLATLPAAELAAGWVEVLKTALIAGGRAVGARSRGGAEVDERTILACARTKLAVVAADERDGGRRQVLNLGHTRRARDRDRHRLRALPPRRGGRARACSPRCACPGSDELRAQVRELLAAHGLPVRSRAPSVEEVLEASAPRQEAPRGGRVPFVLVRRARRRAHRLRGGRAASCARGRGAARMSGPRLPHRGDARRQPRPARPPRPAAVRHAHAAELEEQIEREARALGLRGALLPDQPRGRVRRAPALAARASADAILLNPGAWTHYAWAIRDALEIAALPALEMHLSDVQNREPWRRVR